MDKQDKLIGSRENLEVPRSLDYTNRSSDYSQIGFRLAQIQPSTGSSLQYPGGTISFNLPYANIDPLSSFLDFTIHIPKLAVPDDTGLNVKRICDSGHSIIQTMVISLGSQEIERIEDYDMLAFFLGNISIDPHQRKLLSSTQLYSHDTGIDLFGVSNAGDTTITTTGLSYPAFGAVGSYALSANSALAMYNSSPNYDTQYNAIQSATNCGIKLNNKNDLCIGCNELILEEHGTDGISKNVVNGLNVNNVSRLGVRFQIPLLSSLIGALSVRGIVCPSAFGQIRIDITLNPYFLVACGISDTAVVLPGSNRAYVVDQCTFNFSEILLPKWLSSSINQYFLANVASINLNGVFHHLDPVGALTTAKTLSLPVYFTSINTLLFGFVCQNYRICVGQRKQSTVSNCLAEISLKAGTMSIPENPIRGNAGNGYIYVDTNNTNNENSDCSIFLTYLMKTFNVFENSAYHGCITRMNFTHNGADRSGFLTAGRDYCSNFLETGRAMYGIPLESITSDRGETISGLNSIINPLFLSWRTTSPHVHGLDTHFFFLTDTVLTHDPSGVVTLYK